MKDCSMQCSIRGCLWFKINLWLGGDLKFPVGVRLLWGIIQGSIWGRGQRVSPGVLSYQEHEWVRQWYAFNCRWCWSLCDIYLLHQFCSSEPSNLCGEHWSHHKTEGNLVRILSILIYRYQFQGLSIFMVLFSYWADKDCELLQWDRVIKISLRQE